MFKHFSTVLLVPKHFQLQVSHYINTEKLNRNRNIINEMLASVIQLVVKHVRFSLEVLMSSQKLRLTSVSVSQL